MQKRFWIPESTPMGSDYQRFKELPEDVQKIYTLNLQWQIAADTAQTPNLSAIMETTNNIELKRCLKYQLFIEDLHSGSYNYIVASMYDNPTEMLDQVELNRKIFERIDSVAEIAASCETPEIASIRLLAMEALSFTTSFLTTMTINHIYPNVINNTFLQIQKIASDENDHVLIFSNVVKILLRQRLVSSKEIKEIFEGVISSEIIWAEHIYKICPLPQLNPKGIRELLNEKANAIMRGLRLEAEKSKNLPLLQWYNRTINIDNTVTEQQAGLSGAYVTDILMDDWE
jgi:ribonucleoside-diphosphate reductase beta chain